MPVVNDPAGSGTPNVTAGAPGTTPCASPNAPLPAPPGIMLSGPPGIMFSGPPGTMPSGSLGVMPSGPPGVMLSGPPGTINANVNATVLTTIDSTGHLHLNMPNDNNTAFDNHMPHPETGGGQSVHGAFLSCRTGFVNGMRATVRLVEMGMTAQELLMVIQELETGDEQP